MQPPRRGSGPSAHPKLAAKNKTSLSWLVSIFLSLPSILQVSVPWLTDRRSGFVAVCICTHAFEVVRARGPECVGDRSSQLWLRQPRCCPSPACLNLNTDQHLGSSIPGRELDRVYLYKHVPTLTRGVTPILTDGACLLCLVSPGPKMLGRGVASKTWKLGAVPMKPPHIGRSRFRGAGPAAVFCA